jgi:serine/threonine protein phosphatase PrpC
MEARTDLGRVRKNNEDNFVVVPEIGLYVLSDGMGGEAHGEVASGLTVDVMRHHCLEGTNNPETPLFGDPIPNLPDRANRLASAVRLANRAIYESAQRHPSQKGMGATVVAFWMDEEQMSVAHVGDSRLYRMRQGQLEQITQDHSLVAEQVRRGILTQQQADTSQMQSVLIRALGIDPSVDVDAEEHPVLPGDTLVLCSDGLNRMVTDLDIGSILNTSLTAREAVDRLIELANENGGEDNITVIVLRVLEGSNGMLARLWRWLCGE